jgi:hypothetical protein
MFKKREINISEKCGEKVVTFVLNLVPNYTAYVDTGLPLRMTT